MSNILGIVIGVAAMILGLILLVIWWSMFIKGLMAVVPILLILIGAGALVFFISEIKSKTLAAEEKKPSGEALIPPSTPEPKEPMIPLSKIEGIMPSIQAQRSSRHYDFHRLVEDLKRLVFEAKTSCESQSFQDRE